MHNTSTPPVGERRLLSAVTEIKILNSELSLYVELHHVSGYREKKKNFSTSELSLYVELHHK